MAQFAHGISALDVTPSTVLSAPVWLLGQRYDDLAAADFDAYKRNFESILWFTYRRDFPVMTPYDFTSDAGWGCMLRSAQMILGQALQRCLLGRDWRLPALFEAEMDTRLPETYVQLLRWFADSPDLDCRYSLHHMVKLGMQYDKLPGEWYGPTTAAQVLRDLVNLHRREFGGGLAMYVPQEGVVYSDDVTRLCVSYIQEEKVEKESNEDTPEFFDPLLHPPTNTRKDWSTALLILIPLRLGLDQLNECYVPAIQKTFAFPQSLGIIGGKKGHSVYFVGTQQDQLHLLDPHDVHPAPELNAAFPTATHLRTVHSSRPLVMNVTTIDPSLALGFLCENLADYEDFERRVQSLHHELKTDSGMCPFSVASHRPDYAASGDDLLMSDCLSGDDMNENESANGAGTGEDEEDDYVLL
ncbi:cysteine protease atg4b [Plasmopara halstedii]|uniref:Cysteine protease n=1 Tax=Plasmopara halstedii TaxID=4781 RepID=A0A0P1AJM6_PLAHL|nr:cysteine protease atg4b [Plasmopara halstedii]CEG41544.1 cysteine protease atg4b [Plasmopara halstedii]|eukprot:XP_024577913.1 cysteine protease atg4b [Plasmopara halstedii]